MPEGTAIIDGRLAALRAVRSTQWGAAIFAMRQGRPLLFSPTEKAASTRRRLFDCRYRRIAQNKFCYFIGHSGRFGIRGIDRFADDSPAHTLDEETAIIFAAKFELT